ncbi:hypothetical protein ACFQVC_07390 [Streptomyces monticola]|uniref:Uncharacterized protein n=1 Tax=Streptomyces monticola TaxID=2666263 RepID=A0ABW2JF81_9ACTN
MTVPATAAAAATDKPLDGTAGVPQPPDPLTELEMKRQAKTFHTFGKMGNAHAETSNFAGDVFSGEKDPLKLREGLKKADASLDNLLAIAPGGSPAHRAAFPGLAETVKAIKAENRKLAEARARDDFPALVAGGTTITTQLSLLTAQVFTAFGFGIAQGVLEGIFKPPKQQTPQTPQAQQPQQTQQQTPQSQQPPQTSQAQQTP